MTMASIDSSGPSFRSPVQRHWVLFLIAGVVMVIVGRLAAAAAFVATLVVDTFVGWMLLTAGSSRHPSPILSASRRPSRSAAIFPP
jgi:uncharacterized membrane protein HdeD (DUF308 family)